jgi:dTDP-4-dehydrorhamnose 3,5-epimerase
VNFLQRIETSLHGVLELHPKVFRDGRGFFLETFHLAKFLELGIAETFIQDNHSCSRKGALRGLHYQLRHPQAKLCRVVEGQALDVVVDVREGSPQFGKWTSVVLSSERQNQIYVPAGFAHGFLALTDTVHFLYKCSDYYHPEDERGVLWNDPALKISWGIESPTVSEKDEHLPTLTTIPRESLPRYAGA